MITGALTSDGEPTLPIAVDGPAGTQELTPIVDTGFNGELTLPKELISDLNLPEWAVTEVTLADGRVRDVQTYVGVAHLGDHSREVLIAEAPTTPLLGTDLLWGFSLAVEFQAGGAVEVSPLNGAS